MRVAVLGAGGVGLGTAAYLMSRGHEPVVWSPSGATTKAFVGGAPLEVRGRVEGKFALRVAPDCRVALDGAEVVLIAAPGNGHRRIMDQASKFLRPDQVLIVSSHCSLSALYLSKLLAERGIEVPIAAWATTVVMPNRTGEASVEILTIRRKFDIATLPVSAEKKGFEVCRALFGDCFERRADLLAISLSNLNPPIHMANALCNLTRIERGERWFNYDGIGAETVGRLIEALDEERLAVARAYGVSVRTVRDHFHLTHGVPMGSVAEMAREVHARRGGRNGPPAPASLDTRYITEDVPFGLVPVVAIGKAAGIPMPLHEAGITLISGLYGVDFRSANDILPELDLAGLRAEELHRLTREGWRAR